MQIRKRIDTNVKGRRFGSGAFVSTVWQFHECYDVTILSSFRRREMCIIYSNA
jgi:hypothetical protein